MRQEKIRLVGALGLLAATAVGLSTARGQGQDSASKSGGSTGQSNQLLITHALGMAIEGSELQLTIHQACSAGAAGTGDHAISGSGSAGVNASAATNVAPGAAARSVSEDGRGCQIQLEHQVRKSFENSHELMTASERLIRGETEARGDRAGASQLHAVANVYANSLNSIARECGWDAGSKPADRSTADQGQAEKGDSTRNRKGRDAQVGSGEFQFTTADVTMFTLINHAVRESLNAFELNHSVRDMGANDAAVQQLRNHAKSMAADGRESVNEIVASLHENGPRTSGAASDDKAPGNRAGAARAESQAAGPGSQIKTLAQQAREVIRVLDELDGQVVAAPKGNRRRSR
jgi:hypothetical protein